MLKFKAKWWGCRFSNKRLKFSAKHGMRKKKTVSIFLIEEALCGIEWGIYETSQQAKNSSVFLPVSENRIDLPSTHQLYLNDCNIWQYVSSERWFVRASSLEKKTLIGCVLGDQGLLLRQWGDMSRLQDVFRRWSSHLQWMNGSHSPPTLILEYSLIFWFPTCIFVSVLNRERGDMGKRNGWGR